jgi:hypothetical protein
MEAQAVRAKARGRREGFKAMGSVSSGVVPVSGEKASVPAQDGLAALVSPSVGGDLAGFLGHSIFNSVSRSGLGRYIISSHSITLVTQA